MSLIYWRYVLPIPSSFAALDLSLSILIFKAHTESFTEKNTVLIHTRARVREHVRTSTRTHTHNFYTLFVFFFFFFSFSNDPKTHEHRQSNTEKLKGTLCEEASWTKNGENAQMFFFELNLRVIVFSKLMKQKYFVCSFESELLRSDTVVRSLLVKNNRRRANAQTTHI